MRKRGRDPEFDARTIWTICVMSDIGKVYLVCVSRRACGIARQRDVRCYCYACEVSAVSGRVAILGAGVICASDVCTNVGHVGGYMSVYGCVGGYSGM